MWNSLLNLVVIIAPFALTVLGARMGVKLSKQQSHKSVWIIIVIIGIAGSTATWWQQERLRKQNQEQQDRNAASTKSMQEDLKSLRQCYVELAAKTPIVVPNSSKTQTYTTSMSGGFVAGGSFGQKSESKTKNLRANMEAKSTTSEISIGWVIDVKRLGLALKESEPSSAAIISDTTSAARDFAKHLATGLRMGGWIVGGDNFADREFFSDLLAIEISSNPASADDHSFQEAKSLLDILKTKFNVEGTLYQVDLKFPPNFMRIKVAGNRYD